MSTDNNKEGTLSEMVSMSDEEFTKMEAGKEGAKVDDPNSKGTTGENEKPPEKDTTGKPEETTEEDKFKSLSKEDIIKQFKEQQELNEKLKKQVLDQKVYIDRKNEETGTLRKAVKDTNDKIQELNKKYESTYIADPTEARKIGKEINELETKSQVDSERLVKLESLNKNFETIVKIHPDIEKYIPALVEKWKKDPKNDTEQDKKTIKEFETNYMNMVNDPIWLAKELTDVKVESAQKTEKKPGSVIDKLSKASDHSTDMNGGSSETNELKNYDLGSLIALTDEQFAAYDKKLRR